MQPFPYKGCRRLLRTTSQRTKRCKDLTPDLSYYQMNLSGLCSWKDKIRLWPLEKMQEAQKYARCSFFEALPLYKPLEPRITKRFTPDLYENIQRHEQMRRTLLNLLTALVAQKEALLSPEGR